MHLWHKDILRALPRQQLISQWRECCLIASKWAQEDTPEHMLMNPALHYPLDMFVGYTALVVNEIKRRGYKISWIPHVNFLENIDRCKKKLGVEFEEPIWDSEKIYPDWHNDTYLEHCYLDLQEKYSRGNIKPGEWTVLEEWYVNYSKEEIKE